MAEHIQRYGNSGKGNTSYLSHATYEQFITLMSQKVINTIIKEVKTSKYFSVIIDPTPDLAHIDQLSFIIRYVKTNGEPVERFIGFIENFGHKAESLANTIFKMLNKFDIDIKYLRGQSYDNARKMAGIYSGVQARIKEELSIKQLRIKHL